MLKPERVTFSADDDNFYQLANSDQLNSVLNDSLVHYSTDFKKTDQPVSRSLNHSNSLDQLPSTVMSSQEQQHPHQPPPPQQQQQQQQIEHEPLTASPIISEEIPILNETNLRQFDALKLQQLAVGSPENLSNINEQDTKTSPAHSISYADIQKEVDRVRQMKYGRTYSSPTSSLCSRLTINPFNGSNNNIDLSSITQSVHFTEQLNKISHLPFSSTFITSIPESVVPASSSSTDGNHFIPIPHIESPSLEDREVFETFHTKQTSIPGIAIRQSVNSLNRNISTSETDLIASLDRSASKQGIDNQSEHGTTYSGVSDDVIFLEWDKERNLFQDYINSLRTEIRVLLQERSEYQKNIETINNNLSQHKHINLTQLNTDQTKLDLLKKSLEEKNLVLEQLQKEYETVKEKNANLARKISVLRCDAKSQSGVIDELKQKITELTVDLQNHIIVKRRLEISMMNLENDCKIIDAERIRLSNDVKDTQLNKQDLEKLLQQANVQIAEQGSTIEMLRSDNIEVRSQLSATQRRMLQEKQQVMDYLRQIENDLIEKEQIKQRESILRKDYDKLQLIHKQDRQDIEKLSLQINQDKQKLDQLEQERLQLFKTIQNIDDNKGNLETELDSYKSATKRLYTYFKIPFDSIHSIDQLIPMLEDRYRTEQVSQARIHDIQLVKSATDTNHEHETEEIRQLREDLLSVNIQLKQLNDANQAWQQYQQNQIILLRDRLNLTNIDNLSFDDIVQQIENRFNILNNELVELQDVKKTTEIQAVSAQYIKDHLYQSKDTQTEDAQEYKPMQKDESAEILIQKLTINSKQYEEELRELRENLATLTTQAAQLDEANQAWQQYHRTQLDNFRNKLQPSLPIEIELSLDDIAQYIANYLDQMRDERENLREQLQTSEKLINDHRSQSTDNILTTQENFASTINELNQKLLLIKQQNDQLETEKFILNQQILNQESTISKHETKPSSSDSTLSAVTRHRDTTPIHEPQIHSVMPIQSASPLTMAHDQELAQLRETVTILTDQCAQLDEANRAWQQYHQTQVQDFQSKLKDYLPLDQNTSLDSYAEQIIQLMLKTKEDFNATNEALREEIANVRLESGTNLETIKESYVNAINELNQELLAIKNQYEALDSEKQRLVDELGTRTVGLNPDQCKQNIERISSNLRQHSFDEALIHSRDATRTEDGEAEKLRETVALLTTQCAQLDEANRAWQQYHQTQLDTFKTTLQEHLPLNDTFTLDQAAQQILNQIISERQDFNQQYQALEKQNEDLRSESGTNLETIKESYVNAIEELNKELNSMKEQYEQANKIESSDLLQKSFQEISLQSSAPLDHQDSEEIRQLRENLVLLTSQLDETNRAAQQYQQTQLNILRNQFQHCLSIDFDNSFDVIAQQIADHVTREREDFNEKYQTLEKQNEDLRSELTNNMESIRQSYVNTVNELNQELLIMKKQCEECDTQNQLLTDELEKRPLPSNQESVEPNIEKVSLNVLKQPFEEVPIHMRGVNGTEDEELGQLRETVALLTAQCTQLDEANRAWQQYLQTQVQDFRSKLQDYLPVNENISLDYAAEQIIEQISKERQAFNEKYETLEKAMENLELESGTNLETIKESYVNTIDELSQELAVMNSQCEQLDADKQRLSDELERRTAEFDRDRSRQNIERVSSNLLQQSFEEVPIHRSGATRTEDAELGELRETVALLTAQCTQLDEANRAWQQYHQTQVQDFRSKLQDYLSLDENISLDFAAEQIIKQISKERSDFNERYNGLETLNADLRLGSGTNLETIKESYVNTVDELSQELAVIKSRCEQLDADKQRLSDELERRTAEFDRDHSRQNIERVSSNLLQQSFEEVPIHRSVATRTEDGEAEKLRETVALLTTQCAQLDEANRAWQQYHQTQLDTFKTTLQEHLPLNDTFTLDQAAQQILNQIISERQDFNQQYQALEKQNEDLRSESGTNLETIKESYVNAIEELNKELNSMKEQFELISAEKQFLTDELAKSPMGFNGGKSKESIESGTNLETIKESYVNAIEELNKELNSMKEQFELISAEKQFLTDELAKSPMGFNGGKSKESIDFTPVNAVAEISLQTAAPVLEQDNEELLQLRENFAILTSQYAQLSEANRAWQEFHQSQVNDFRTRIQDCIQIDDDLSFDAIAQKLVNEITAEREYSNERYQASEKEYNELQSESVQSRQELLFLKEQFEEVLRDKQSLMSQIENQSIMNNQERDTQAIELVNRKLLEQQSEISQLQQNLDSVTAQLDETNHSRQQSEQTQLYLLKSILPHSTKISLDELTQEIISYVNHLTTEMESLKEKAVLSDEESQHDVNQLAQELNALQNHCTQLDIANRTWQLFYDNQIDLLKEKFNIYINIDNNQSFDQIIQLIAMQFEQQKQFNENIQLGINQDNFDLLKQQLIKSQEKEQSLSQQIYTLEEECQNLEEQLKESQYSIDSLKTNLQLVSNENEQLKQQYDDLQQKSSLLTNVNQLTDFERQSSHDTSKQMIQKEVRHTPIQEVQIHRVTPVRSAHTPNIEEEIRQLRADLSASSAHCLQLEEANRAWQQFHQSQLEIFRNKLQTSITLDDNFTLEQVAQQILIHFEQLEKSKENVYASDSSSVIDSLQKQLTQYQFNESMLSQNLEQLNKKLLDVSRECDEFRENNAELILSKQQLQERLQQIDEIQLSNDNSEKLFQLQQQHDALSLENQQLQSKLIDMEKCLSPSPVHATIQRIDSPRENVAIHNVNREHELEIYRLRADLATASARCLELEEVNLAWQNYQHDQIESLRKKLQEQIPSLNEIDNASIEYQSQQIIHHLDHLYAERDNVIRDNDLLKDELRILKQQLERPRSTEPTQRIFHKRSPHKHISEPQIHSVTSSTSASPLIHEHEHEQELLQYRESVALLTTQCAQLDEANRAWQQYHQTQLDTFKNTLQEHLPMNDIFTLDQAAQQILNQIISERQDFNQQYQALEKQNEDLRSESGTNWETIKESYVNAIEDLNQELVIMKSQCEQLDVDKQRLSDELERRTTEFDRDHSRQNIERVSSNLLQQSFEEVPIHRSGPSHTEMVECGQLRETVALLTAQCSQLDETNRASQQYHQTQVLDFLSKLQEFLSVDENTSLDAAVEQIVEQISKERSDFHERFERLEKESERLQTESKANADAMQNTYQTIINGINEELVAIKKQCEEWKIEKQYLTDELEKRSVPLHQEHVERNIEKVSLNLLKQSFAEVPIHTSSMNVEGDISECQQLRETVASFTTQCAQLDEANQAWQMYHHTQLQEFRNKLQDYLSVDDNVSFDIVAQQIIDRISSEREDFNNKYQALVNKFDGLRSDMTVPAVQQSEMNTANGFNEELSVIKEVDQKLYAEKQPLMDQIESFSTHTEPKQDIEQVSLNILKEPREQVSIHTSSVDAREDIEELQKRIAHLTSECAQLDEANRTWQRYEQTQLDNFRNRLQDYISIDEHISFDDVIHKIIEKIVQDRETLKAKCADFDRSNDYLQSESTLKMQLTEQPSTDYVDELNQELAMLRNQNEELHRINKHLVFDKENLSNQLNDRSIVLGHHTVSDLNQIPEENTDELKENSEGQSSSAPIDAEEMEKIRADLTSITDQFNQLIQTNRSELDSFRDILQNWISLPENSTLDDIAQQLKDQFEQRQQNVPHTTENQTQTIELTEKIHMAIETTPVIYENHQTQIDLVDTNDEETQTESFQQLWPILKDDNLYNHDEDDNNLLDYIDEISSLSPTDLTDRLNKECQQILIKKNLSLSSYDNLQLNHHALMTIYLLYKQHLTDDAKQLYNETLIRALRLEYELINNEKHDYMEKYNEVEEKYLNELNLNEKKMHQLQNKYEELLEHNELERLDSKKILNDLAEKYEFNLYNLHQENENLKYNLSNMSQSREKSLGNDHNQLQSQYQQLRQDYDELISENELLKDYNSQMYQRKLQRNADDQDSDEMVSLHDIDIQCNLSDERQAPNHDESSWSNNWTDEKIQQEKLVPEQKSTEDDEINRLKSIISDIQFENENLKELNAELYQIKLQYTNTDSIANESIIKSQDIDIQCLLQPITIDSFVQTEHENEPNQLISSVTEDNDWNDQLPIIEIPLGEPNVSSVTVEHKMPETVDNEAQTDEQTQDKLSQINNKLKRALQTIKDRIHQIVIEQPELFSNTNDDTLERLDHLRIIIRNQAMQINDLQNSYEQAQDEINQMQSSLEVCQDRIDNEHITKTEELASSPPSVNDRSQSAIEDSEKQIHQLQQKLSQNDDEKLLLRERLNEVELELRKVLDDHTSTRARYEEQLQSLITERDAIFEQQVLQSNENQHQIQKLEDELAQVKQSVDSAHAATTSNEDVKSLQEIIQEQSDEMKDLSEKYFTLVSQLEVQDEILKQKRQTEEQLKICENQIQHLINEHAALSEELQNKTSTSVSNIDNESQTDEQQQQDKLVQLNHKLKRALQTFKDKIHRLVTERPELFTDVGEETTERFDHLITTVEHQA
ncbi:unnamed protein product, partial [Rotaria socialis]